MMFDITKKIEVFDNFVVIKTARMHPEISILFPTFQRQEYIKKSLESILKQRGVVAEIIISDDGSVDNSFQTALDTVADWLSKNECGHQIVMRRGKKRLLRDHIHIMADQAQCDLVCQAHDDDMSHPDRAKLTVDAFRMFKDMTMMSIEHETIHGSGDDLVNDQGLIYPIFVDPLGNDSFIPPANQFLVGACQAWKKSGLKKFPRLDSSYAAVAHDWILAFRCALAGEVRLAKAPLVKRRIHSDSWSSKMFITQNCVPNKFEWHLQFLSAEVCMLKDLEHAFQSNVIDKNKYDLFFDLLENARKNTIDCLMDDYKGLTKNGFIHSWTKGL